MTPDDWLDEPLGEYIRALSKCRLGRPSALRDGFFLKSVRDVLNTSDAELRESTLLIPEMGPKTRGALFDLIHDLRNVLFKIA